MMQQMLSNPDMMQQIMQVSQFSSYHGCVWHTKCVLPRPAAESDAGRSSRGRGRGAWWDGHAQSSGHGTDDAGMGTN